MRLRIEKHDDLSFGTSQSKRRCFDEANVKDFDRTDYSTWIDIQETKVSTIYT